MTTREELQDLFNRMAFPETPEERDDAENAVVALLAQAWEEGAEAMCGQDNGGPMAENPYTVRTEGTQRYLDSGEYEGEYEGEYDETPEPYDGHMWGDND